jgi:hypothetical protein
MPYLAWLLVAGPKHIPLEWSSTCVGTQKCRISIHLSLHHSSHFIAPLTFHDTIFIIKYGLNLIIFQIIYFSIKREFVIKY